MDFFGSFGSVPSSPLMDSHIVVRNWRHLFLCFLLFRLVNALAISTFHVADEYWQTLEVAHRSVFGYGFLTWEWQPAATLRSFLHPGIFASLYYVLKLLGLDEKWPGLLEVAPKLLQATIASFGDICLHYFAAVNYGPSMAFWFTLTNLSNWFLLHNLTRTLANSIETTLFSVFLCFWPVFAPSIWVTAPQKAEEQLIRRRRIALLCAGVCFLLRPTSAITWVFFAITHLIDTKRRLNFIIEASLISVSVLAVGALIDMSYYGSFVSPLWSFVRFNFLSSGAAHYGSHPWHWYLSSGIPMLLGPYMLPFVIGLWSVKSENPRLGALILVNVLAFSIIGHKEARFLMPLIPIFNIFVAQTLYKWWHRRKIHPLNQRFPQLLDVSTEPRSPTTVARNSERRSPRLINQYNTYSSRPTTPTILSNNDTAGSLSKSSVCIHIKWILACILITASFAMAFYTCAIHQRGTIDLMHYVRDHPDMDQLLLLMPCHHTPGHAYIHRSDFDLDYLDCSPGLGEGKKDEADVFFDDPMSFLRERYEFFETMHPDDFYTYVTNPYYEKNSGLSFDTISKPVADRPLPTHIAMYDVLAKNEDMVSWLRMRKYKLRETFFHAHFADGRTGTKVLLYRLDRPFE